MFMDKHIGKEEKCGKIYQEYFYFHYRKKESSWVSIPVIVSLESGHKETGNPVAGNRFDEDGISGQPCKACYRIATRQGLDRADQICKWLSSGFEGGSRRPGWWFPFHRTVGFFQPEYPPGRR